MGKFKFLKQRFTLIFLVLAAIAAVLGLQLVHDKNLGFAPLKNMLEQKNSDDAFNGIELSEFENFYRDWHLVTARYRVDRNQQRVTFANPIAWKALVEGSSVFPEGAMFAKAGFQSAEDPLFPSSKVPGSQLRLMLMKRDWKKYPNTDGWGYALLNRFGTRLSNGEVKYNVEKYRSTQEFEIACHACHKIAAGQDFVFSKPMFEAALSYKNHDFLKDNFQQRFRNNNVDADLKKIEMVLAESAENKIDSKNVYFYEMLLFEGSLPELKAPLSNFANMTNSPFLVFDSTSKYFAMSSPLPPTPECHRREVFFSGSLDKSIPTRNLNEVTKRVILCDGVSTP